MLFLTLGDGNHLSQVREYLYLKCLVHIAFPETSNIHPHILTKRTFSMSFLSAFSSELLRKAGWM